MPEKEDYLTQSRLNEALKGTKLTHVEVYNCYGGPMLIKFSNALGAKYMYALSANLLHEMVAGEEEGFVKSEGHIHFVKLKNYQVSIENSLVELSFPNGYHFRGEAHELQNILLTHDANFKTINLT